MIYDYDSPLHLIPCYVMFIRYAMRYDMRYLMQKQIIYIHILHIFMIMLCLLCYVMLLYDNFAVNMMVPVFVEED